MKWNDLKESINEGRTFDRFRRSNLEPKGSNWEKFALMFDIGVLDLDNLAAELNFDGFEDLDISIGPESLLKRDKAKFIKALKNSSMRAKDMKDNEIVDTITSYYS